MSISAIQEYEQYNMLSNMDFNNLLSKLYSDIQKNNDITWLYNRFLSPKIYYKLIYCLDFNTRKKFNKINENIAIQTKSKLSYDEIENMLNDFYDNEENEVNDYNDNLQNEYDDSYDDIIYHVYKKSEKD